MTTLFGTVFEKGAAIDLRNLRHSGYGFTVMVLLDQLGRHIRREGGSILKFYSRDSGG